MQIKTLVQNTQVTPEIELVIGPILFFINRRFGHIPELFGVRMHRVTYPNGKSIRFYKLVKNQHYRQASRVDADVFERLWQGGAFEATGEHLRLPAIRSVKPLPQTPSRRAEYLAAA